MIRARKRANLVSVQKLFSGGSRLRPAALRRGFVWDLTHVAQLMVDLEISAREDDFDEADPERLYLGVLAVSRAGHGAWIVRDGLQRLTTLSMFLAFARDRLEDPGERHRIDRMLVCRSIARPPEPRLRLLPEEHAWYSHFVLQPGATSRLPVIAPIGSPKHLVMAARFMEQAFENYSPEELSRLADFAANNTAFVRTIVETVHDMPTQARAAFGYGAAAHHRVAAE